jgi:RNA polymerase sigma factor (sigma-70 family)
MEIPKTSQELQLNTPTEVAISLQRLYRLLPERDYQLDPHQDAAITAIGEALADGKRTGYVEMATSTGKTYLESLLAEAAVLAGKRVLMLAPSVQIADQIYGRDGTTGLGKFSTFSHSTQVCRHYGTARANDKAAVVVSTYHGLLNEAKNDTPQLGNFDVIIADECHRSLGAATSQALVSYMPDALKIGFSATPDYAHDRTSEEIYDQPLFEYSLLAAIEAGVTAPVRPIIYETGQTLELSNIRAEFTESELAPLLTNMERNGAALNIVRSLVADGRQGIVACVPGLENAHARLMAHLISETADGDQIIKAAEVGSHLPREEQERRLAAYAQGDIDVLTFTRTLEEGWDSKNTSFCLNLAPTTSPVRTKQLLGRVLRPSLDGRVSVYVDFVDTMTGIAKQPYTAYHALELEDIDMYRTIGRKTTSRHASTPNYKQPTNIDALFNPEIYQKLLRTHGKSLREVTLSRRNDTVDPTLLFWERRLERDGMPAELPYNIALTPKLDAAFRKTVTRLLESDAPIPSLEAAIESMPVTKEQKAALAHYALRDSWDESIADSPAVAYDSDEALENVITEERTKRIERVLETLSEREANIIALRFGLTEDGQQKTYDEVGRVFGINRERARQIDVKAFKKLLHPTRTDIVAGLLDEDTSFTTGTLVSPDHTGLLSDRDFEDEEFSKKALANISQYSEYLSSQQSRELRKQLSDTELQQRLLHATYRISKLEQEVANSKGTNELAPTEAATTLTKEVVIAQTRLLRNQFYRNFLERELQARERKAAEEAKKAEEATRSRRPLWS